MDKNCTRCEFDKDNNQCIRYHIDTEKMLDSQFDILSEKANRKESQVATNTNTKTNTKIGGNNKKYGTFFNNEPDSDSESCDCGR